MSKRLHWLSACALLPAVVFAQGVYPNRAIRFVVPSAPGGIANATAPALYPGLPYDPIKDFVWITNMAKVPVLLVAMSSPQARILSETAPRKSLRL